MIVVYGIAPPFMLHDHNAVEPVTMDAGFTDADAATAGHEHVGATVVGPLVMGQDVAVEAVFRVAVVLPCVTVVKPAGQFVSEPVHCEPFQLVPPGQLDAAGHNGIAAHTSAMTFGPLVIGQEAAVEAVLSVYVV